MKKIRVKLQPNAKTSEVVGFENGVWKVRVNAPPVEGKANEALVKLLAVHFDVSPSRIEILKGHTSKEKVVLISSE